MGGYAYIIPGKVASGLIPDAEQPSPERRPVSIWRRILGRAAAPESHRAFRVISLPGGDRHFEIPAAPLETAILAHFFGWIHESLPVPSKSSRFVLEYLEQVEPAVYVRGMQRAEEQPTFYVQVAFSGCSGEAEVSARVCAHWTSCWYEVKHEQIGTEHFLPFGFQAKVYEVTDREPLLFLPAGDLGYLEYTPREARSAGQAAFDVDVSIAEAHEGDSRLGDLEALFGSFMAEEHCRCQLCEPTFEDATASVV